MDQGSVEDKNYASTVQSTRRVQERVQNVAVLGESARHYGLDGISNRFCDMEASILIICNGIDVMVRKEE